MVMRIGGLASGFDTDSIIQKLMQAQRIPMDKLSQKKQTFEWQRNAYRELNTKLTEFRNNAVFNMKLESNVSPKKASIVGNSTTVQASASANASSGSIVLDVQSLAKAASNYSSSSIGTTDFKAGNLLSKSFEDGQLNYPDTEMLENYSFKINGAEITVDPTKDTLNSVITKINRDTNVTAFYDSVTGQMSFMSKETGSINGVTKDAAAITFEDVDGDFLSNVLKVTNGSGNEQLGEDAVVTINGMQTTRSSNSFSINGVQITLLEAKPGSLVTINISNDVDATVNKIKEFITSYNEMLSYLNNLSSEPKYRSFVPLTTEQKAEMSEKEIENWEKQAKSGLLRGDPIIAEAINALRSSTAAVMNTGNPDYKMLTSIGITSGNYAENGKLYLSDENKLREALADDPDAVMKMFTMAGEDKTTRSDEGVAARMHTDLMASLDLIAARAGKFLTLSDESPLSKLILGVDKDITAMNRRLTDIENKYYRQFGAMETAINKLNSQSTSLMSAFGGSSN
jgi:flagellar hook-associated protein 2